MQSLQQKIEGLSSSREEMERRTLRLRDALADVVAKAYLGRKVKDPYDGKLAREASLIAYGPQRRDGTVSWAGGQRKLRGIVQLPA